MKEILTQQIEKILTDLGVTDPKVSVEPPARMEMGDYATSVALVYAKELGKKPLELAQEIVEKLLAQNIPHVASISAVAPGFVNFSLDAEYFGDIAKKILSEKEKYGKNDSLSGQKFFIEHTQPNPFKEFHIGHLMNNTIGDSLARVISVNGAETKTATYHGDVGMHVAKAIWYLLRHPEKENYIGNAYVQGNKAFEIDEKAKQEIVEINTKIYNKSDEKINNIYQEGREFSFSCFESLYERLGSHFDYHFYESQSGEIGKKLVLEFLKKGVFEESEGAIIYKGEKVGLHTRVFLNSERLPTYEAKEVGLAEMKKNAFPYDKSLTVTANEQDAFFKVVERAICEVFPELSGKLKHISHGMLKLPTGKMSSRTGSIITAQKMIDDVKDVVLKKMTDREMEEGKKESVAEIVAIGALKYSILHQSIGGDIIFDFEKSVSFEGDSGPYLQYSAVRANSLLKKAAGVVEIKNEIPAGWQTTNLERLLERYPQVVEKSGREYAPHYIVTYLIDLAGEFNSFYASHKIIDADDQTSPYRLALTQAFVSVMTSGLSLLGIRVPEEM